MKSVFEDAMSSASYGANLGQIQAQVQSFELQNKVRGLRESSSANLTEEQKAKRLREACEGFESIFIQKMWQQMRATVPKDSNILYSRDEEYWQGMYDQELAKSMASAGGIGLADMMYEQLSRNLVSASRGTASALAKKNIEFPIAPAPFLPENNLVPAGKLAADTSQKAMLENLEQQEKMLDSGIYEGQAPQEGLVAPDSPLAKLQPSQHDLATQQVQQALAVNGQATNPQVALEQDRLNQVQASQKQTRNRGNTGSQLNGLQLAQQAQREAGDKLSRGGVRPARSQQRQNVRNQTLANNAQNINNQGINNQTAMPFANANIDAALAEAAEQRRTKVQYTTNIPSNSKKKNRNRGMEEVLRGLSDVNGANSANATNATNPSYVQRTVQSGSAGRTERIVQENASSVQPLQGHLQGLSNANEAQNMPQPMPQPMPKTAARAEQDALALRQMLEANQGHLATRQPNQYSSLDSQVIAPLKGI